MPSCRRRVPARGRGTPGPCAGPHVDDREFPTLGHPLRPERGSSPTSTRRGGHGRRAHPDPGDVRGAARPRLSALNSGAMGVATAELLADYQATDHIEAADLALVRELSAAA